MLNSKASLLPVIILLWAAFSSHGVLARTWRVAKDGMGDYSVIQDAVNAAADGDTILIGPGRYNDGEVVTCPGWTDFVRVLVTKSNLTFIGSGPTTIIGQEQPWELGQGDHRGIVAGPYFGCTGSIRVENIRFENTYAGIVTESIIVNVSGCEFSGIRMSAMSWQGASIRFDNCSVSNPARDGSQFSGWYVQGFVVSNCQFDIPADNYWPVTAINLWAVTDVTIERCTITGGHDGIILYLTGPAIVEDCVFTNQSYSGITLAEASVTEVNKCIFVEQSIAIFSNHGYGNFVMRDTQIHSVEDCSLFVGWPATHTVSHCDLAPGARGVVWAVDDVTCQDPIFCDMTNNYWGTDSPDSIRAWIRDINDTPYACIDVDFEPYASQSTPTETINWGSLKALFR